MEVDLISKKELLEQAGISYGALYRWKRKGLIPDGWFIRKSTFTGQETFFPRKKILDRIELIQIRKENVTLDDLADELSPVPTESPVAADAFAQTISPATAEVLKQAGWTEEQASRFGSQLRAACAERLLSEGIASREETADALEALLAAPLEQGGLCLLLYRKQGVGFALICPEGTVPVTDSRTRLLCRIPLDEISQTLKEMGNETWAI